MTALLLPADRRLVHRIALVVLVAAAWTVQPFVTPTLSASAGAANTWAGSWATSWTGGSNGSATMTLTESGSAVSGTYDHDSGEIRGTADASSLAGTWTQAGSSGSFTFTLATDGKSWSGSWDGGAWSGTCTGGACQNNSAPATSTVPPPAADTTTSAARPSDKVAGTTTSTEATTTTTAPSIAGVITVLSGDVEYRAKGSSGFVTATLGTVVHEGDFVSTSFDSSITLKFPYGQVKAGQTTQLRVDEFLSQANLSKTQLFVKIGSVQAKVKHTAAIRSDFSVLTPTANSSIRGSEMIVTVASDGVTSVYTTEDVSTVQGNRDAEAMTLAQGNMTTIKADGRATAPRLFTASDLPAVAAATAATAGRPGSSRSSWWIPVGGGAVLMLAIGAISAGMRRRRQPRPAT